MTLCRMHVELAEFSSPLELWTTALQPVQKPIIRAFQLATQKPMEMKREYLRTVRSSNQTGHVTAEFISSSDGVQGDGGQRVIIVLGNNQSTLKPLNQTRLERRKKLFGQSDTV